MTRRYIQSLLVIGLDTAALAKSARNSGYTVYASDHYGDQDLRRVCKVCLSTIKQKSSRTTGRLAETFAPTRLLQQARKLSRNHQLDGTLLASGLEDHPHILAELHELAPIIGNYPRTIQKTRDKPAFFKALRRLNIPHPQTIIAETLQEAKKTAKDIGYPIIIKPPITLGGANIKRANNKTQLETAYKCTPQAALIQEYVPGKHASLSLLSTKKGSMLLTINQQLLGVRKLGQKEPFGYCGNLVPLTSSTSLTETCSRMARRIVNHFGLIGSNGIDIVISKDDTPYVVEVNPRFQGSLECVESITGLNLVNTHISASLQKILPTINQSTSYCARLILYTKKRTVAPSLAKFKEARDIPLPNTIIEEGEPLCSLITQGKTRSYTLMRAKALASHVYKMAQSGLY